MDPRSHFSFKGRLARRDFFRYFGLSYLILAVLPGILLPHGPTQVTLETAVLALFLPAITRRLHDIGRSLWVLGLVLAPYAAVLAVQTTGVFGNRRNLIIILSNVPFFICLLSLYVIRGTKGPNRFGEEPPA